MALAIETPFRLCRDTKVLSSKTCPSFSLSSMGLPIEKGLGSCKAKPDLTPEDLEDFKKLLSTSFQKRIAFIEDLIQNKQFNQRYSENLYSDSNPDSDEEVKIRELFRQLEILTPFSLAYLEENLNYVKRLYLHPLSPSFIFTVQSHDNKNEAYIKTSSRSFRLIMNFSTIISLHQTLINLKNELEFNFFNSQYLVLFTDFKNTVNSYLLDRSSISLENLTYALAEKLKKMHTYILSLQSTIENLAANENLDQLSERKNILSQIKSSYVQAEKSLDSLLLKQKARKSPSQKRFFNYDRRLKIFETGDPFPFFSKKNGPVSFTVNIKVMRSGEICETESIFYRAEEAFPYNKKSLYLLKKDKKDTETSISETTLKLLLPELFSTLIFLINNKIECPVLNEKNLHIVMYNDNIFSLNVSGITYFPPSERFKRKQSLASKIKPLLIYLHTKKFIRSQNCIKSAELDELFFSLTKSINFDKSKKSEKDVLSDLEQNDRLFAKSLQSDCDLNPFITWKNLPHLEGQRYSLALKESC
ncbi:hypothetical protein AB834_02825 [PVC group bacterium (ex Bugula neritina AB1)]|nr:hypothetical protein AB834_02825 [PVC group bacterium (ex Bugula neritina AB1)]